MKKQTLELKIDVWFLVAQVVEPFKSASESPDRVEIAHRLNRYNGLHLRKYGEEYSPK